MVLAVILVMGLAGIFMFLGHIFNWMVEEDASILMAIIGGIIWFVGLMMFLGYLGNGHHV